MPLFFLPFTFEVFEISKEYLLFFLVGIGFLAWLAKMIFKDKKISFSWSSFNFFVLGYLLVMILASIFSKDGITSLLGFYGRFWPNLIGILSLIGFYFLLINNVDGIKNPFSKGQKSVKTRKNGASDIKAKTSHPRSTISYLSLIKSFIWSISFLVLITYFSLFNLWSKINDLLLSISDKLSLPSEMLSVAFNPINGSTIETLVIFLSPAAIFLVVLLTFRELLIPNIEENKNKAKKKIFGIYVLLFAILGILSIVNFRPTWLIISLSLFLFLVISFKKRIFREDVNNLSLPIFFLVISLIFYLFNPLQGLFSESKLMDSLPEEVLPSQSVSWSVSMEGLKESPLLGAGLGNFSYLFNKFKPQSFLDSDLWRIRFNRSSSHISEVLGTTGIIGTLSYLLLIGAFFFFFYKIFNPNFRLSFKNKSREKEKNSRKKDINFVETDKEQLQLKFQLLVLLTFFALFISQFFYYQNVVLAFSFWLFLGMGVISWDCKKNSKSFDLKNFPEANLILTVFFWVILFGFLFFCFFMGRLYWADIYYYQYLTEAENQDSSSEELSALEKAVSLADLRTTYHIILAKDYLREFSGEIAKNNPDDQIVANMVSLAVKEAKRAVELSPNRVAAQEVLGFVYRDIREVASGASEWGIKAFERAIELEPRNPILLTELGKLHIINDDLTKARELLIQALEKRSDYPEAILFLGTLEEKEGNTEKAIEYLKELVKINPFSVDYRFQLGRLYYNQNKYDEASQQFEIAIQLFPSHSNSLYSLALIYEKQGDINKAIEYFTKVSELNPDNEEIKNKIKSLTEETTESEEEEEEGE
jgi:tetratricopeptide (TPR) repeat protein